MFMNKTEQDGVRLVFYNKRTVGLAKERGLSVAEYVIAKKEEHGFVVEPEQGVARVYMQDGSKLAVMDRVVFQVGSLKNMPWVILYDDVIGTVLENNPTNMVLRRCGVKDISHASNRLAGMDFSLYLRQMFGQIISRDLVTIVGPTNDQNMAKLKGVGSPQDVLTY